MMHGIGDGVKRPQLPFEGGPSHHWESFYAQPRAPEIAQEALDTDAVPGSGCCFPSFRARSVFILLEHAAAPQGVAAAMSIGPQHSCRRRKWRVLHRHGMNGVSWRRRGCPGNPQQIRITEVFKSTRGDR